MAKIKDTCFIYTIVCTETNKVMYVGKTKYPNQRKQAHFFGKTKISLWIHDMVLKGFTPKFKMVSEVDNYTAVLSENYWIDVYLKKGEAFFNYKKIDIDKHNFITLILFNQKSLKKEILEHYIKTLSISPEELVLMRKGKWYKIEAEKIKKRRKEAISILRKQMNIDRLHLVRA